MAKTYFICSQCGYKNSKWLGKCPECGEWNTFVEEIETGKDKKITNQNVISPVSIIEVAGSEKDRLFTQLLEFDRVLGGIVPGQAILLSGEPGIGKSTLILRLANVLSENNTVYYINGEESNTQIKLRADRIGVYSKNLYLLSDNNIDNVSDAIGKNNPAAVFIDSIQTVYSNNFNSLPGSVVQIRETSFQMINLCKEKNIPLFLIGHITKSGVIAGPKVIEHMVDTVLFLEADARGYFRILRSMKNRFYSTDEIGIFTMEESGLKSIENESKAFTYDHQAAVKGISLFPHLEGNRVFPVEIQALCAPSQFNYPRRTADGMDINRLYLLIAIMEKRLRINLSAHDIYVNITNGLRIEDPALDLAVINAVYSSFKDQDSPLEAAVTGEVGLTGEVRPVLKIEKRIVEMERAGFKKIIIPYQVKPISGKSKIYPVKTIEEAVAVLY